MINLETTCPVEYCAECGKCIPDDEWVTNWGSCNECFNKHLDKYFKEHSDANE